MLIFFRKLRRRAVHFFILLLLVGAGIGAALAVELGTRGWRLALGARRMDRLERVAQAAREAGATAIACALDVTDPASIDAFWHRAEAELGDIDTLISKLRRKLADAGIAASCIRGLRGHGYVLDTADIRES